MATRIPRAYRRPLTATRFRKKILGRIYLDTEREFVAGAFHEGDDGKYRLREDLTPEDKKRLARIAKEIKKNRGLLRIGRIAVPLLIVGGAVAFNLLFLDRILETNGEKLLERVFGAQVEIEQLDAQPMEGRITLAGLIVADRDRPMRNLFEFGPTTIAIRMPELFTGRVVIREISTTGIAFGTERTTSGALDDSDAAGGDDGSGAGLEDLEQRTEAGLDAVVDSLGVDGIGGLDDLSLEALSLDVEALIADARDDLTVTTLVPEAIEDTEAAIASTEAQLEGISGRVRGLGDTVQEVAAIDPSSLTNPQTILSTVQTIESTRDSVSALGEDARTLQRSLEAEIARLRETEQALRNAAQNDLDALQARIPDFDIDPSAIAEAGARAFVAGFLGEAWNTVQRVIAVAQRVRAAIPESTERDRRPRRGGVDIPFSETPYPRFVIERLAGDGGDSSQRIEVSVTGISSDPDLTDSTTEIVFRRDRTDGRYLHLESELDLRSGARMRSESLFEAVGAEPSLPEAAQQIGFASLNGATRLSGGTILFADGALAGTLDAVVTDPRLSATEGASPVAELIAGIASEQEQIDGSFTFELRDAAITDIEASTSLTELLRAQVEQLIADLRAEAEARIREEIDRIVAEQIERLAEEIAVFDVLVGRSTEELLRIETYEQILDEQKTELESRVADIRDQAEAAARAAVEQAEAQARAEAEAAAEAAAREAESRVRDAAGGIRLPGRRN